MLHTKGFFHIGRQPPVLSFEVFFFGVVQESFYFRNSIAVEMVEDWSTLGCSYTKLDQIYERHWVTSQGTITYPMGFRKLGDSQLRAWVTMVKPTLQAAFVKAAAPWNRCHS